ncbi:MAG: SpoIIE family protein phosphatase [Erysipelotrichales bacterium]|nr:SpoIIE family protein phosphatase [Erysipelotrichales bacterium]
MCFIALSIKSIDTNRPTVEYHPYQKSADLLRQFSSITQSLISTGSESTLVYALQDVLENNAKELEQTIEYDRIPSIIQDVLAVYKYEVVDLEVVYDNALYIHLKLYNTSYKDIISTLIPILEVALHTTVYLQHYDKADLIHSYHECLLMLHPCISIKYDSVQRASRDVCGDEINVVFRRECTTFLLSDGMGEGYQAKSQSTFAIRFISQLIQIGVPFQTMIKLINQLLLLKQRESFATLDILSIDSLTRRCLLYKSGSAQTYLIRNGTVMNFVSESLPLGIVSKISPDVYTFDVRENDLIVMMSDGAESECMEEWLKECKGRSPTTLVKHIYEKKEQEGIVDDLSILGVSVQKNSHF